MKYVKVLMATFIFVVLLAGCGGQPSDESDESQMASGETSTKMDRSKNALVVNDTDLAQLDGEVRRHGGVVVRTESHFFEIVFRKDSVRLYAYNHDIDRIPLDGVLGRIQLQRKGRLSKSIKLRFHPEKFEHSEVPDEGYLEAHLKFSGGMQEPGTIVLFHLTGIPGTDRHVYFSVANRARLSD
jgi:hypothetical protein